MYLWIFYGLTYLDNWKISSFSLYIFDMVWTLHVGWNFELTYKKLHIKKKELKNDVNRIFYILR